MTPIIIALTQNVGIEILRAYNKHQKRTLMHLIMALVNIVISIPLTKMFGEIGCAIGTCFSTFISSTLIANYFYSRIIKLDIKLFFLEMLKFVPSAIILFLIGIVITWFADITTWFNLIIYILIFSCVYFFVMINMAFNQYEKDLLTRFLNKLIKI